MKTKEEIKDTLDKIELIKQNAYLSCMVELKTGGNFQKSLEEFEDKITIILNNSGMLSDFGKRKIKEQK